MRVAATPATEKPGKKIVAENGEVPAEQKSESEQPRPKFKKSSRTSGVLDETTWLLKREERIIFPTLFPYRLDLLQTDGTTPIGSVVETTNRWFKMFISGTVLGRFFPIHLGVFESNGERAPFSIRIPALRITPLTLLGIKERRVEILNEDGELTCSFVMKLLSLTPSYHVYDGDEQKIADFKFKTLDMKNGLPPRMILLSLEGQEWGSVTGENEAAITEKIKAGKKFVATVSFMKKYSLLIKVSPAAEKFAISKQMLIAAAVAMRLCGAHKIFDNT